MAKRQTIWLSTMMVLSLMLIGFYTVNNNTQAVLTNDATTGKTAADQKTTSTSATSSKGKAVAQAGDYFVAQHLEDDRQTAAKIEALQKVIADTKSTPTQVDQAKKDLEALNANKAKIDNLHDKLQSMNYPDALINVDGNKVIVTVEAQHLETKNAVQIMDTVQKQFPSTQVSVAIHE